MVRIRRVPPSGIEEFHRHMEQVVSTVLHGIEHVVLSRGWVPRLDMYETGEGLSVILELPGVRREDIEVTLDGPCLLITGVRDAPAPEACVRWHQVEIANGPFEKVIVLPWEVDTEGMKATYQDGFLRIEMPRASGGARNVPITSR